MGKHFTEQGFVVYEGLDWRLALPPVILGVHLSIIAGLCAWAARRMPHALFALPATLLAGWLGWTLFEYALHRWLLHHVRRPLLRRVFWEALHKEHHRYRRMGDPDHHGVHIAITAPMVIVLAIALGSVTRGGAALGVYAGFLLGYCEYETLHWMFHTDALVRRFKPWRPFARLYLAHTIHHLDSAAKNYGFVTGFWDRVFGTWAPNRLRSREALAS